jgi:hypothetical protein
MNLLVEGPPDELQQWSDPHLIHHVPHARYPAYRPLDGATLLRFPRAAVEGNDELAGADVRTCEFPSLRVLSQGASHELDQKSVVGDRRAGVQATLRGRLQGGVWEGG